MRPGLEVMHALLGALDHPERTFSAIHVTGSKGKGSVTAMAASILRAHGTHVGMFTSPHLKSYRERIQIDGRPISRSAVVDGVGRVQSAAARLLDEGAIDRPPTFFEVTTALAFDHFRTHEVRWAAIEVGLGGRLDSTNVLTAPVGVITTIEEEHAEILGGTIESIAREKAGILHPGMRAIVGTLPPEAAAPIERAAATAGVHLSHLGRDVTVLDRHLSAHGQRFTVVTPHATYPELEIPLFGKFQTGNAAIAVAAADLFLAANGATIQAELVRDGLKRVKWRGRLERAATRPDLFIDVAHTPESASAVAESLAEIAPFTDAQENVVLFGCLSDKKYGEMLNQLEPLARTVVLVPVPSDRSAALDDLRRAAQGLFSRIVVAPTVRDGLAVARAATGDEGFTLAVGSDYLAGELLRELDGGSEDEPDLSDPATATASSGRKSTA